MRRIDRVGRSGLLACGLLAALAAPTPGRMPQEGADGRARTTREAWDAVYIAGRKVGHIHTRVEPVTAPDGRELLRVQYDSALRIKRLDDDVEITTRYGTIETYDGQVLRLDAREKVGPTEMRVFGDARGGKMPLTLQAGGRDRRVELDWPDDVRGPYGPELSLSREPIAPGQSREVKTFIPNLNVIGSTRLEAKDHEDVELGGGAVVSLLRVDSVVSGPDGRPMPGMDTSYWVDSGGQILKSRMDAFGGLVTFRTTEQAAKAPGQGGFDIVRASIVPVSRQINNPGSTRSARYRVRMKDEPPGDVFPGDPRQSIRPEGDGSAVIEVRTVGPGVGPAVGPAVGPEFLAPNPMINSEDPAVVALTRRALSGAGPDSWSKVVAINLWVANNLRQKNFEQAFATASDVAKDLSGDCSEHSVLAAAMLRAAGIPARVVVGLLYVEDLGGFGFHMWNEAFVDGRWVAVDPTLGQSEVDAVHLKLSDTSLDGVSPFTEFLQVVRVFDKLQIEPLEVR